MKHPFHFHILPLFTVGAGGLGFALRLWLFSNIDEKGLLPAGHPTGILLLILSAAVVGILFLAARRPAPRAVSKRSLRPIHAAACLLGGIGLILNAFTALRFSASRLATPALALSLAGGAAMILMGVLRFLGKRPPYWLAAVLTIVLMIDTVAQCQVWGAEPQLQVYCFPLLASVFLILTAYQETALLARKGNRSRLAFCSQCAAFFCCLSFNNTHRFFYMGLFLWALMEVFFCLPRNKEANHDPA